MPTAQHLTSVAAMASIRFLVYTGSVVLLLQGVLS